MRMTMHMEMLTSRPDIPGSDTDAKPGATVPGKAP